MAAVLRSRLFAPLLAALLASIAVLTGAQGVDLAAATYRVELFARSGLTLWDSQWYGGHWTFDYSVLFAPVGWLTGIPLMEIACVAIAAWAFDRLAVARFARAGRAGAVAFAVGTLVQVAIGQEPYLLGETLALCSLLAATRRVWWLALPLAVAAPLASPLAGAFLVIASLAWLIGHWPSDRFGAAALAASAGVPIVALEVLFPGLGTMPFDAANFIGMVVALGALALVTRHRDRAITVGIGLYAAAVVLSFAIPSSMGNNITRLGVCFGVALVIALAVEQRRGRILLLVAFVPLALAQWAPAASALFGGGNPSTKSAYFKPLLGYLARADRPLARVEVVPTALHWESAYVAPSFPLARGWERQLDTENNTIFYRPGALTKASYRSWLIANGVRFVALPDVPLDYAAIAEGRLLRAGVPGLRLVWRSAHWRVYAVAAAPGLVSGPARLLDSSAGGVVVLDALHAGRILVRERYVDAWRVTGGAATVTRGPGGWLSLTVRRAGRVTLRVAL